MVPAPATSACAIAIVIGALGAGCGSAADSTPEPRHAARTPVAPPPDAGPPAPDAAPPLDEATARVLLAARFRAAGLRIRADVARSGAGYQVTLDGFDPEAGVGYEYVAASERGGDLDAAEIAALAADGALRVLVVDACPLAELERQAAAFLAAR